MLLSLNAQQLSATRLFSIHLLRHVAWHALHPHPTARLPQQLRRRSRQEEKGAEQARWMDVEGRPGSRPAGIGHTQKETDRRYTEFVTDQSLILFSLLLVSLTLGRQALCPDGQTEGRTDGRTRGRGLVSVHVNLASICR